MSRIFGPLFLFYFFVVFGQVKRWMLLDLMEGLHVYLFTGCVSHVGDAY